jgi:threonine/homoserine/homoserine lactone efflux protein
MILSFMMTCLVIEATPGPNMGYLALLGASRGRRAGFAAVAGVACGLLLIGLVASLGVGALIVSSPFLYGLLRWGGVLYMLWLAWESWREEPGFSKAPSIEDDAKYFRRGFITNVLNPKAAVFYITILPAFISGGVYESFLLTIIYVLIATIIHAVIVAISGAAQKFLNHARRRDIVRKIFAVMLAVIAVWLFFKT